MLEACVNGEQLPVWVSPNPIGRVEVVERLRAQCKTRLRDVDDAVAEVRDHYATQTSVFSFVFHEL